ncbi:MAG: hypothetical protein U0168_06765 [Nannocystaceae bacterium]
MTLNLQRKDPDLRADDPCIRRAGRARGRAAQRPGPAIGPQARAGAHAAARRRVLGRQAFERLSGLIRELCIVNVDARFVGSVYAQVAGEQQFAGQALAPLAAGGLGAPVRIFRTDLKDILANVFHRSLRSSLSCPAAGEVGRGAGDRVRRDRGLEHPVLRSASRTARSSSSATRCSAVAVERGMGITVDLLSRYDGSIAVEAEPGWNKAVVLRFFMLEDDATSVATVAA